jgi:hypothetical protein
MIGNNRSLNYVFWKCPPPSKKKQESGSGQENLEHVRTLSEAWGWDVTTPPSDDTGFLYEQTIYDCKTQLCHRNITQMN